MTFKIWNSENAYEMATIVVNSKMPLSNDEAKLVNIALSAEPIKNFSVYDLYDLNILCYMVRGYIRRI